MSRLSLLPIFILLCSLTPSLCTTFKDVVRIRPCTATKYRNGTIVFSSSSTFPPLVRSLTLIPPNIAKSPFLFHSGTFKFTPKGLILKFSTPRIKARFKLVPSSTATKLRFSGIAKHIFKRPFGMRLHRSRLSVPSSITAVQNALEANPEGPRLVTVIDHAKGAESVGLKLAPASVIVFGNPGIGSQLWRKKGGIGLELPLEILAAESVLGVRYVGWNVAGLLKRRFGLPKSVDGVLETIDSVLVKLGGVAAGKELGATKKGFDKKRLGKELEGVALSRGKGDAVEGYERLSAALEAAPPVNIAYEVKHDVSAIKAGLETDGKFNRVAVFGNPALGTGVMQQGFTAALDLPVRMSVYTERERRNKFFVAYTKGSWIGDRHAAQVDERLEAALANFAKVALGQ